MVISRISKAQGRKIVVVGAGVAGVATAYACARRGMAVTLVDRAEGPGTGASFANGAQLSYVYTDALARPGLIKHLPELALGRDPAFSMHPGFDPQRILWLLAFLRNATSARFRENTVRGLQLGLESRLAMQELLARHPLDFAHAIAGKIVVHQDADTFGAAAELVDLKRGHGARQEVLDPAQAIAIEPALANRPEKFAGAIYSPQEELGDPHRFCVAMVDILVRQYGVGLRFGAALTGLRKKEQSILADLATGEGLEADQVILCTAIDAGRQPGLGLGHRLMPMKGYSITAPPGPHAPSVSLTDVARKIVFCPLDGAIRIAGLAQLGRSDTAVDPAEVAKLTAMASASLPDAADYAAAGRAWAGIRPMTPDSVPIIRRMTPRIAVNVGHGMLGWTFAMGAAERVARLIGGEAN